MKKVSKEDRCAFVDDIIADSWIRPQDKMPKEKEHVWCLVGLCSSSEVREGCYTGNYWDIPGAYGRVIAWQPIRRIVYEKSK